MLIWVSLAKSGDSGSIAKKINVICLWWWVVDSITWIYKNKSCVLVSQVCVSMELIKKIKNKKKPICCYELLSTNPSKNTKDDLKRVNTKQEQPKILTVLYG